MGADKTEARSRKDHESDVLEVQFSKIISSLARAFLRGGFFL